MNTPKKNPNEIMLGGHDWTLLKNEAAWKRWCKKHHISISGYYRASRPDSYPCLAREFIGADENPYDVYAYPGELETALAAMKKASG